MKIGFTGSRKDPTPEQLLWLKQCLEKHTGDEFHHGDCVGADSYAHHIAEMAGLQVIIHPPTNSKHRAYCFGGNTTVLPAAPYLVRNHSIVDSTDALIAMPDRATEKRRSGTWATVRYANKQGKPVVTIYPNCHGDWASIVERVHEK